MSKARSSSTTTTPRSYRIKRKTRSERFLHLLPERVQGFAARRFVDTLALGFFLSGVFLVLSLLSYHHADPSWNTAGASAPGESFSDLKISNWMGIKGAWVADFFSQTVGVGGFVFGIVFILWGLRCFARGSLQPLWLRLIALLIAALCTSVAFAQIPSGGWIAHPYLGSSVGTLVLNHLGAIGLKLSPWLGPQMVAVFAAILALASGLYAAFIGFGEFIVFLKTCSFLAKGCFYTLIHLASGFQNWLAHHNDPDYRPDPFAFFKGRLRPEEEGSEEEEDTYDTLPPSRRKMRKTPCIEDVRCEPEEGFEIKDPELEKFGSGRIPHIPVVSSQPSKIQALNTQQRLGLSDEHEAWEFPSLTLLESPPPEPQSTQLNEEALRKNAELLQNVLSDFNIEGNIVSIHPGPVVTLYEMEPAPGTKSSKIIGLSDDIARSMSAVSVRVAVVPGRNVIGIELPNKKRQIVYMQELLASPLYEKTALKLPLALGKDIGGQPILADLAKMPHLLVAGTTGSGKSVAVNTMILSLLFHLPPEKCRFIMIDPKMLELSVYDGIPHLLAPVVTDPGKAIVSLKWTVNEMEERYRAMSKMGVRNIDGYNERIREAARKGEIIIQKMQTGFDLETGKPVYEDVELDLVELPYIVVIVDEFADLMLVAGKDVESSIQRLAQMARAAGIHLIMATQRPSVDVITGVIKANFPTRISFQVTSKIDSRTILGEGGAEQLLGMGDMLYMAPGGRITRVHGPFVSDGDVEKVVNDLKSKAEPSYIDSITEGDESFGDEGGIYGGESSGEKVDELYDQAVALVAREGKASTSFVQRYLQIGYNRAARIIEEMERQGVVSKSNAVGKRTVLIGDYSDI